MKLSLTVICGNVAPMMRRFFTSFAKCFDEIVVVRAIGNQEPDESLAIAHEFGAICAEYHNAPEQADWPHVDNFAAARNKAARLASGDWLMWLDTDDVPGGGEWTREALEAKLQEVEKAGLPGMMFPYTVPEDGIQVMRERLWKKDAARWEGPIHETLVFSNGEKTTLAEDKTLSVLHAPVAHRAPNDARNLRILESIPESERTISQRFHLFMSLRAVGRAEEGIPIAMALVQEPAEKLEAPERYELLISLGQLAQSLDTRHAFYLQALAVSPERREAYGELALTELNMGRTDRMRSWLDAMKGLETMPAVWNLRRKFWTWQGVGLQAMALRAAGDGVKADALELNWFLDHGAKISLCHATRGRTKQAAEARKLWMERASDPDSIEHIFAFDDDDEASQVLQLFRHVRAGGAGGPVEAWNLAAARSHGEVIVQLSDDWDPPHGWDKMILDAIGDTSREAVLAVSDGSRTDDLMCMAIVTRARYQKQGNVLFHPDFFSVYSDNWFSHCAWRDGVVIDARKIIVFQHNHPAFEKGAWDGTYARSNAESNYQRGRIHYDRLLSGCITSHDVHGWCNYRPFYTAVARHLPQDAVFVEIGSWMGQSIIHFAQRCQDLGKNVRIHVVDTFRGEEGQEAHVDIVEAHGGSILDTFKKNIKAAGVEHMITIHVGDSAESAALFEDGSVDACYVDAAHEYEPVLRDLRAWLPKMKPGGIFSGHDYQHEPVRRAVDETMAANGWEVAVTGNVWVRQIPEGKP